MCFSLPLHLPQRAFPPTPRLPVVRSPEGHEHHALGRLHRGGGRPRLASLGTPERLKSVRDCVARAIPGTSWKITTEEARKAISKTRFQSHSARGFPTATAAMSETGDDVNDLAEEPVGDAGEDPFGGSDLEPVTDEEDEDDDGEDLLENQEMCVGSLWLLLAPSRISRPRTY